MKTIVSDYMDGKDKWANQTIKCVQIALWTMSRTNSLLLTKMECAQIAICIMKMSFQGGIMVKGTKKNSMSFSIILKRLVREKNTTVF